MNRLPLSDRAREERRPWPPMDVRVDLLTDVIHRDIGPSRRVKVFPVKRFIDPRSGAEVVDEVVEA